jgi:hypothetical protein
LLGPRQSPPIASRAVPPNGKADDDDNRHRGICHHMDNGGTHVVVAMRCAVGMLVLSKFDDMDIAAVMRLTRTLLHRASRQRQRPKKPDP